MENTILATFDVISLYTNITLVCGLETLSYWVHKHPSRLQERFYKQSVLESARLTLKNQNCKFNGDFFL